MFSQCVAAKDGMQVRQQSATIVGSLTELAIPRRRRFPNSARDLSRSAIVRAVMRNRHTPLCCRGSLSPAAKLARSRQERRRYPRRAGRCLVAVLPALTGTDEVPDREWAFRAALLRGPILDLSMGGVSFALPERIEPGQRLDVELRHPHRSGAVVRRVVVIAHHPEAEDRWKLHCRFLRPLSYEEVSQLSLEPTV
jgi:hypothetical protein